MTTGAEALDLGALSVEGRTENLGRLRDFVEQALRRSGVPEPAIFDLLVALDEVAVNIVEHGYAGGPPGPIRVALTGGPGRVSMTIADRARPFDPAQAPPPDLTSDLDERPIGGLGWHIVRHLADELRYAPDPRGGNVLTLVKRFSRGADHQGEAT